MKILIVDDNKTDRMLLNEFLKSRNYDVSEAGNGIEALVSVEESKPDLIISDIMMPQMDGFALLHELKAKSSSADIPLVFYSAQYGADRDIELVKKLGASRFIAKPEHMEKLLLEIETVLKEYEAGKIKPKKSQIKEDEEYLREYSQRIVSKLEDNIKQLENEIVERKKAEDEVKQILVALARSNAELEQFVHFGSRDLQHPLKSVLGNLQLLSQRYSSVFDQDDRELFLHTIDDVSRMQKRNNDLIAYSRIGTKFKTTDCESLLKCVLEKMDSSIKNNYAVVTHDLMPVVNADDMQLAHLFHNLIDNALKFRSKEPPRIHIGVQKKVDEWEFRVKDNGIGIDPEAHDRIFLISQRIYGKDSPSTGMGLAICKKIVERHGGKIWVDSKSGMGSTFYFTIPIDRPS